MRLFLLVTGVFILSRLAAPQQAAATTVVTARKHHTTLKDAALSYNNDSAVLVEKKQLRAGAVFAVSVLCQQELLETCPHAKFIMALIGVSSCSGARVERTNKDSFFVAHLEHLWTLLLAFCSLFTAAGPQ